jgi:hypothetical protein
MPVPPVRAFTPVEVLEPKSVEDADHLALMRLISEVVPTKPQTKEEAVETFHALQLHLGTWVVSSLPAVEAKSLLVELWNQQEPVKKCVDVVDKKSCFGRR